MFYVSAGSAVGQNRPCPRGGLVILLLGMLCSPAITLAGVEEEIRSLRQEMQEMKKDVADIKELLEGALKKAPPAKTVATVGFRGRPMLGRPDAPVTIVEFSDYQCPYCQRFATNVFLQLKRDYVDAGKVRYVFRDFPLMQIHPQAAKAHEGAHCAGEQGRYWEMHDLLFERQKDLSVQALSTYANQLGLETDKFDACLESGRYAAAVQADMQAGAKADVRGTPSFIIGKSGAGEMITGTIVRGAQPFSTFQQVIQAVEASIPAKED